MKTNRTKCAWAQFDKSKIRTMKNLNDPLVEEWLDLQYEWYVIQKTLLTLAHICFQRVQVTRTVLTSLYGGTIYEAHPKFEMSPMPNNEEVFRLLKEKNDEKI